MICLPPRSTLFPYTTLFRSACAPTPTPSPLQGTATALQNSFSSQYFLATQQSLMLTLQASGGQPPFLIVTSVGIPRSEEHTSELQSQFHLVCRLLLEKKNVH